MNFLSIEKIYNLSRVGLMLVPIFFFASCVPAQNTPSQKSEPKPSAVSPTVQPTRFQSVKSCKILPLPADIFGGGFDPLGGYKIVGGIPAEYADFDNFTLDRVFKKNPSSETNEIVGGVVIKIGDTNQSDTYQIDEITLSPQEIHFSTEVLSGISYKFSGKFLKQGDFTRFNEKNISVLKGTLKKFKAEKLAAEKEFEFKFNIWKAKFLVPNC